LRATQAYFCAIPILPFDELAAAQFRTLQSRRIRIGTNDLRIAAIALARQAILVTSNRRDFERIAGLGLEDWQSG
jgi:tRNA(fMet)-specific endonuclease VapC